MKRRIMTPEHMAACQRRADATNKAGRVRARELGGSWGDDIRAGSCMIDGGPSKECEAEVAAAK